MLKMDLNERLAYNPSALPEEELLHEIQKVSKININSGKVLVFKRVIFEEKREQAMKYFGFVLQKYEA